MDKKEVRKKLEDLTAQICLTPEVCQILDVSKGQIWNYRQQEKLHPLLVDGIWVYLREEVLEFSKQKRILGRPPGS